MMVRSDKQRGDLPVAQPREPILFVGIGVSDGGAESLRAFFSSMPADSGMAFLVVQQIAPEGQGLRPELLREHAALPVAEAQDGARVEANQVYLIPTGQSATLTQGVLRIAPRQRADRRPIDTVFHSLAEHCGNRAVGVLLSEVGADGALGMAAISAANGMTLAQERAPASHEAMQHDPLAAGVVDHLLPPAEMAPVLVAYAQCLRKMMAADQRDALPEQITEALAEIAAILQRETKHDFRHYKARSQVSRIQRRMQVLQLPSIDLYLERLRRDRDEVRALFNDLLIGVTSFFRVPQAFEALSRQVIAGLLHERSATDTLRIWVPGCATGEEAYSIAMLLQEQMDGLDVPPRVQIFATDIDEHALKIARQGIYPAGITEHVSAERLARFFVKRGNRYCITSELRGLCLFSRHNLISDPPFSRLDLVSCRNVLIYLQPSLQQKLMPLFHFALRPGGYLFLGSSESLSFHKDLFRTIDPKHRISQRRTIAVHPADRPVPTEPPWIPSPSPNDSVSAETSIDQVAQRIVMDELAPRYAVVNDDGEILSLASNAGTYLEHPGGPYRSNILTLARPSLRAALREAVATRRKVVHHDLPVQTPQGVQSVTVCVQPMPALGAGSEILLVVFQDTRQDTRQNTRVLTGEGQDPVSPDAERPSPLEDPIGLLERELISTREQLERTIQELEAANEELKSSNEEMQLMNEELHAANDELEVSKEELQATNEALSHANTRLESLLASTRIATVSLDEELRIQSFSPAAAEIYNLIAADVGRPIAHITHRVRSMPPLPSLRELDRVTGPVEHQVQMEDGRWYMRRVLPHRSHEGHQAGMVITFVDITELQSREAEIAAIYRTAPVGLAVLDRELRHLRINDYLAAVVQRDPSACIGKTLRELVGDVLADGLEPLLRRVVETGEPIVDLEVHGNAPGQPDGPRAWLSSYYPILDLHGETVGINAVIQDITGRKQAEVALRQSEERFRVALGNTPMSVYQCDRELRYTWQANAHPDWPPERIIGRRDDELLPPPQAHALMAVKRRVLDTGVGARHEISIETSMGWQTWDLAIEPLRDQAGAIVGLTTAALEITQRKRVEEVLRDREERLRLVLNAGRMGAWEWNLRTGEVVWSMATYELLGLPTDLGTPTTATFLDRVHPDDRQALRQAVNRTVEGMGEYDLEFRVVHPDDTVRWLLGKGAVLKDEGGRPVRMQGVCFDITERKQAEERVQRVFEQAAVGIALITEDGRWQQANQRLCEILGYAWEELQQTTMHDLTHAADQESLRARLGEMLAGERKTFAMETRYIHKNGELVWGHLSVSFVDPAAAERSFVAVIEDVTARKRYEQATEEAARHKDQFLAMLGHELRNPLAAIRNAVELQRMLDVDHVYLARARDVIERQTTHMARLIDDLLDVSRIARGKIQLKKSALDLSELIATVVDDHRDGVANLGLELRSEVPTTPIWVMGDPTRLAQVVGNLLDNAAKFTQPPGLVTLRVRRDGDEAVIELRDTGIGIEPAMLDRIFDVFQQAGAPQEHNPGGLGLGLSLVRGLVALHQGTVEARSEGLGTGASFIVRLPASDPPLRSAPRSALAATPMARRILIVDDNRDSAEILRDVLEIAGHQVAVAYDGAAALMLADHFHPDTLICDIGLPGTLSGYDVARAFRAHATLASARLIAVTGYGRSEDRERALEAGFDHHLTKPITLERLQQLLDP